MSVPGPNDHVKPLVLSRTSSNSTDKEKDLKQIKVEICKKSKYIKGILGRWKNDLNRRESNYISYRRSNNIPVELDINRVRS